MYAHRHILGPYGRPRPRPRIPRPRPRSPRPRAACALGSRFDLGRGASSTSSVSSGSASGRIQYRVLLPRIARLSNEIGSRPRTVSLTFLRCVFICTSTPALACSRVARGVASIEAAGKRGGIATPQGAYISHVFSCYHAPHKRCTRGAHCTPAARRPLHASALLCASTSHVGRTSHCSMHNRPVLQFDRDALIVELHQKAAVRHLPPTEPTSSWSQRNDRFLAGSARPHVTHRQRVGCFTRRGARWGLLDCSPC